MEQLWYDDVYEAAREVVKAAGGYKKAGKRFFPAKQDEPAANALRDVLNPNRRETLDPEQMILLLQIGREVGCHALMHYLCDHAMYDRASPIQAEAKEEQLVQVLNKAASTMESAMRELQTLRTRQTLAVAK